jgi:copper chaperone CopZ
MPLIATSSSRRLAAAAIVGLLALAGCDHSARPAQNAAANHDGPVYSYTFAVGGMTCTGCENAIETAVAKVEGVLECDASHTDGTLIVKATDESHAQAIFEAVSMLQFEIAETPEVTNERTGS